MTRETIAMGALEWPGPVPVRCASEQPVTTAQAAPWGITPPQGVKTGTADAHIELGQSSVLNRNSLIAFCAKQNALKAMRQSTVSGKPGKSLQVLSTKPDISRQDLAY